MLSSAGADPIQRSVWLCSALLILDDGREAGLIVFEEIKGASAVCSYREIVI